MCELSPMEEKILVNLLNATPKAVARKLGMEVNTLHTYLYRVRKKREKCKRFLSKTKKYKSILYKRRIGE